MTGLSYLAGIIFLAELPRTHTHPGHRVRYQNPTWYVWNPSTEFNPQNKLLSFLPWTKSSSIWSYPSSIHSLLVNGMSFAKPKCSRENRSQVSGSVWVIWEPEAKMGLDIWEIWGYFLRGTEGEPTGLLRKRLQTTVQVQYLWKDRRKKRMSKAKLTNRRCVSRAFNSYPLTWITNLNVTKITVLGSKNAYCFPDTAVST